MKKNFIIKLILLVLIIILISIIISIYFINRKNTDNVDNLPSFEDIISPDETELFSFDNTVSQTEYKNNQIEDIDLDLYIEVMAIDENIEYIIENENAIKLKIKEYILVNNLKFDVTNALYESYQSKKDSDMIAALFTLDDTKETELIVIMDKKSNTIKVKEK